MIPIYVTSPRRAAVGLAHGKLILIGEHAVVHGHPAVALPFTPVSVQAKVEVTEGPLAIDCKFHRGPFACAPEQVKGLSACVAETLKRLGSALEGLTIRIASTIPAGSGLGSSAAVAVAMVRGLFACHDREITHRDLMELTNIAEVHAHGTPSGIDATAAAAERPLLFIKGEAPKMLPTGGSFQIVVANSGHAGDTRAAVAAVRARLKDHPVQTKSRLSRLGELTHEASSALATGDAAWLGKVLDLAQAELSALGVSNARLDSLVRAARKAGALGAKLTGAGRGGCMLALARDKESAERMVHELTRTGARAIWRFTFGEES
jgi:mevalonate kinase